MFAITSLGILIISSAGSFRHTLGVTPSSRRKAQDSRVHYHFPRCADYIIRRLLHRSYPSASHQPRIRALPNFAYLPCLYAFLYRANWCIFYEFNLFLRQKSNKKHMQKITFRKNYPKIFKKSQKIAKKTRSKIPRE